MRHLIDDLEVSRVLVVVLLLLLFIKYNDIDASTYIRSLFLFGWLTELVSLVISVVISSHCSSHCNPMLPREPRGLASALAWWEQQQLGLKDRWKPLERVLGPKVSLGAQAGVRLPWAPAYRYGVVRVSVEGQGRRTGRRSNRTSRRRPQRSCCRAIRGPLWHSCIGGGSASPPSPPHAPTLDTPPPPP